jgi:ABC-2 type transport system ATP-binding protein
VALSAIDPGTLASTLSSAGPLVQLDSVSKAYGKKIAVHELSLAIEAGSMFGLLGPNGAGKTSTIRMIVGITMPDSGKISLFGKPFSRTQLGRVGYLPEERGLYKKMKVLDQLIFMGEIRGLDAATAKTRAQKWCERLSIADVMEKKTEELSKGMQQKIQFIATLLHDPQFLIMDEPFSGLDPVNAVLLQDTLLDLRKEGKAILFSTHRMDQVEKLCDSICLINGGQAVLHGKMRDVKGRYPRNRMLLDYQGDPGFLADPLVKASAEEIRDFGGHVEIKLNAGADPPALLRHFTQSTQVYRYELVEPSLEEIFIQTVGGTSTGGAGNA